VARTEHIVGVAACLAVTDHASSALFSKAFLGGKPLCFAQSPATFVAHTFVFIFTGVTAYVAIDSALNPLHKDEERLKEFGSGTYSSAIGSCTAVSLHCLSSSLHAKVMVLGLEARGQDRQQTLPKLMAERQKACACRLGEGGVGEGRLSFAHGNATAARRQLSLATHDCYLIQRTIAILSLQHTMHMISRTILVL
jgi:hypothetical protein